VFPASLINATLKSKNFEQSVNRQLHLALPQFFCRASRRKYPWTPLRHRQACYAVGGLRDLRMELTRRETRPGPQQWRKAGEGQVNYNNDQKGRDRTWCLISFPGQTGQLPKMFSQCLMTEVYPKIRSCEYRGSWKYANQLNSSEVHRPKTRETSEFLLTKSA